MQLALQVTCTNCTYLTLSRTPLLPKSAEPFFPALLNARTTTTHLGTLSYCIYYASTAERVLTLDRALGFFSQTLVTCVSSPTEHYLTRFAL